MLSIIKIITVSVCVVAVNGRRVRAPAVITARYGKFGQRLPGQDNRPTEEQEFLSSLCKQYNACDPFDAEIPCMWSDAVVLEKLDEKLQTFIDTHYRAAFILEKLQEADFGQVLKARKNAYNDKRLEPKDLDLSFAEAYWLAKMHPGVSKVAFLNLARNYGIDPHHSSPESQEVSSLMGRAIMERTKDQSNQCKKMIREEADSWSQFESINDQEILKLFYDSE